MRINKHSTLLRRLQQTEPLGELSKRSLGANERRARLASQ